MPLGKRRKKRVYYSQTTKSTGMHRSRKGKPSIEKSKDRSSGKTILLKLRSNSTAAGKQDLNMRLIPNRHQAMAIPANFLHQIFV